MLEIIKQTANSVTFLYNGKRCIAGKYGLVIWTDPADVLSADREEWRAVNHFSAAESLKIITILLCARIEEITQYGPIYNYSELTI